MTINERIREVRKALGLTLDKFGERVGVKKGALSATENGRNAVTEQLKILICSEFNVDYTWLTTGEGEMFMKKDSNERIYKKIDRILAGESEFHRNLFKSVVHMTDEELLAVKSVIDRCYEKEFGDRDVAEVKKEVRGIKNWDNRRVASRD